MKPIRFRAEFASDLLNAATWYEIECPGLGDRFVECVDTTLASLQENPILFAKQIKDFRRARVHGFPYGLFYQDHPKEILVVALWHASRRPYGWRARTKDV